MMIPSTSSKQISTNNQYQAGLCYDLLISLKKGIFTVHIFFRETQQMGHDNFLIEAVF